jgi:ParB-like chromosome segregation protein Spo0J
MELEPRTTAPAHATGAVEFVPLASIAADTTYQLREDGDVSALAASMGRLGQLVPLEVRPILRDADDGPAGGEQGELPRYQLVCGFRRLAALRLLVRERALVRVHRTLSEDDAWAMALGQALLSEPLDRPALEALRERLAASGAAPWAEELVDEAIVRAPIDPELRERFYAFLSEGEEAAAPEAGAEAESEAGAESEAESVGGWYTDSAAGAGADSGAGDEEEVTPDELADDLAARLYQVNADLAVAYGSWAELPEEGRRMIVEQARWIAELLPRLEGDES